MKDVGQEQNGALKGHRPAHRVAKPRIRGCRIRAAGAVIATMGLAAVTAAAVLAGTTGGSPSHAASFALPPGAVPWTNRTAPAYTPARAPSPTSEGARYAPCAAADLNGRPGDFGLGAGSYTRYLVLTNVGGHACTLSAGPSEVSGSRANGTRVRLAAARAGRPGAGLIGPANLQPGQSAQVALTTSYGCAPQSCGEAKYTAVSVGVGSSGSVRVVFRGQPFTAVNGVAASAFGVPASTRDLNSSPLNSLTVSVSMPGTVTAGTTVTYAVTLHNAGSQAIAMSPCPSYAEFMVAPGSSPAAGMHRYYLSCQAASQIPAHGSVTFAMRMPAPATSGPAKFGWVLQGTSVEGGGTVMVTGR